MNIVAADSINTFFLTLPELTSTYRNHINKEILLEALISIKKIIELKSEAASELNKIRSSKFTIAGENKILAYYSFRALMESKHILNKSQASRILGQDIPKQVYSKAKKVAEYVRDEKTYKHESEKIILSEGDFSSGVHDSNKRDVMQTYGHIAAYERNLIKTILDDFKANNNVQDKTYKTEDMKSEFLADPKNKAAYDALTPEYAVASAMIKARSEAGLTQAELAKKAGMTQAQVSRLESGEWPTPATIEKLARAFGKRAELRFV